MITTDFLRPKSACGYRERRNPILPSEQPVSIEKTGKALVNQTFYHSKYPQERPKGRIKTEFSKNSDSTFQIASEDSLAYRPSIRVNIQIPNVKYERPQSIKVSGYSKNREPSAEENLLRKPKLNRGNPSPLLRYENQKKYMLPSEIKATPKTFNHNTSKVFEDTTESYLFNGRIKYVVSKPTEISSVIGYEYALQYRDQKVTSKP